MDFIIIIIIIIIITIDLKTYEISFIVCFCKSRGSKYCTRITQYCHAWLTYEQSSK